MTLALLTCPSEACYLGLLFSARVLEPSVGGCLDTTLQVVAALRAGNAVPVLVDLMEGRVVRSGIVASAAAAAAAGTAPGKRKPADPAAPAEPVPVPVQVYTRAVTLLARVSTEDVACAQMREASAWAFAAASGAAAATAAVGRC